MSAVEFSDRAKAQLAAMDPAVADELRSSAPRVLHAVPADPDPELARIEGSGGQVMWHQAVDCGAQLQDDDSLQDYYYFYEPSGDPAPGDEPEFLVLEIVSNDDIAAAVLRAALAPWSSWMHEQYAHEQYAHEQLAELLRGSVGASGRQVR
jgi:hypothetical protein